MRQHKYLTLNGGASTNDFLLQFQSDILAIEVDRPECIETTALGAAYLASLSTGFYNSRDDIIQNCAIDKTFIPVLDEDTRLMLIKGWKRAVRCASHGQRMRLDSYFLPIAER